MAEPKETKRLIWHSEEARKRFSKVKELIAGGQGNAEAMENVGLSKAVYYRLEKETAKPAQKTKGKAKQHVFVDLQREPIRVNDDQSIALTKQVAVIFCAPDQLSKILKTLGE